MVLVLADPGLYEFIGGRPPTLGELTDRYRHQVVGRSVDGREELLNWIVRDAEGCAVTTPSVLTRSSISGSDWGRGAERR